MKFQYDHDLHIHSQLSGCSSDPEQNKDRILRYAVENGLHTVCVTDHFWDEKIEIDRPPCYQRVNYGHISQILPLPQKDNVRFLFGCETEMNKDFKIGVSKERMDLFDFIIIPTTHLHFQDFTIAQSDIENTARRAQLWIDRLERLLIADLPFHKIGIAHLTCKLLKGRTATIERYFELLKMIPPLEMERLFKKAARLGVGIELNSDDIEFFEGEGKEICLLPYQIAKECKCKFYLGSDAHHPAVFEKCKFLFEKAIDLLELEETDKFYV